VKEIIPTGIEYSIVNSSDSEGNESITYVYDYGPFILRVPERSGSWWTLRAESPGTATVTIETVDGGYTASCRVTVKQSTTQYYTE